MRIALIGQPNCGKSTLFNQVAGYKAETGNFSGTTVTFIESKVRVLGQVVELVDLPGTYTLAGTNLAEREVFNYLATHSVDVIINVVDASHLAHSLELTLELMELNCPMVVALNMVDEARRLGLQIDIRRLQDVLGIPFMPLVASRGFGIRNLFVEALNTGRRGHSPSRMAFSPGIESAIRDLTQQLDTDVCSIGTDVMAVKLIEGDELLFDELEKSQPALIESLAVHRKTLEIHGGQDVRWIISGERHARASRVASMAVSQGERHLTWQDRLDDFLLHPVLGIFGMFVILFVFFQFVYLFGSVLEEPLLIFFTSVESYVHSLLGSHTFISELVIGLVQGISGGVAIVLPYLVPFLIGLGLLEDIGYLPRVAFLMDSLMHRLGLHGKAIVPFILGYGCSVPAIMSTRIMEEKWDRFLAAALATLVPCAARMAVIFGLVAFYLGPNVALAIYIFNLIVIAVVARLLSRLIPEDTPGLILEMPVYRLPTFKTVTNKSWFRIREFIIEAWPVLIAGSIFLSIISFLGWEVFFNGITKPISWLLGLPEEVGVPLIFGILRKELSLVMLRQALGGGDLGAALSSVQMVTFSVFVMFYIPCLATLVVLRKELGNRFMLIITGLTVIIALMAALFARGIAMIVFA